MKILLLNYSLSKQGGGYIAPKRVMDILNLNQFSVTAVTHETKKNSVLLLIDKIKYYLARLILKIQKDKNKNLHSLSLFSIAKANYAEYDIINLHWVNSEMLSIKDIGKIKQPVVWTLHDMWPICGTEHFANDERYEAGYLKKNRPTYENGFDLNKLMWNKKLKYWKKPINIICTSKWLEKCVKKSYLMKSWPINTIYNPINTDIWKSEEKLSARKYFNLNYDKTLILFAANGGLKNPRKGGDLFLESIKKLSEFQKKKVEIIIAGQENNSDIYIEGIKINFIKQMSNEYEQILLHSAVDLTVIPSRAEAIPLIGIETMACENPIISFDIGGMDELIIHKKNGWIAKSFDTTDMASGIEWVINNLTGGNNLKHIREHIIKNFSYPIIQAKYGKLFKEILS